MKEKLVIIIVTICASTAFIILGYIVRKLSSGY